jgi:hypothetical protein
VQRALEKTVFAELAAQNDPADPLLLRGSDVPGLPVGYARADVVVQVVPYVAQMPADHVGSAELSGVLQVQCAFCTARHDELAVIDRRFPARDPAVGNALLTGSATRSLLEAPPAGRDAAEVQRRRALLDALRAEGRRSSAVPAWLSLARSASFLLGRLPPLPAFPAAASALTPLPAGAAVSPLVINAGLLHLRASTLLGFPWDTLHTFSQGLGKMILGGIEELLKGDRKGAALDAAKLLLDRRVKRVQPYDDGARSARVLRHGLLAGGKSLYGSEVLTAITACFAAIGADGSVVGDDSKRHAVLEVLAAYMLVRRSLSERASSRARARSCAASPATCSGRWLPRRRRWASRSTASSSTRCTTWRTSASRGGRRA